MKTFKDKNPVGKKLDKTTLDRFLEQQFVFLELLEKTRKVNLKKTKTSILISNFIKLRLGDTLRVQVAHNERHLDQAERVIKNASSASSKRRGSRCWTTSTPNTRP